MKQLFLPLLVSLFLAASAVMADQSAAVQVDPPHCQAPAAKPEDQPAPPAADPPPASRRPDQPDPNDPKFPAQLTALRKAQILSETDPAAAIKELDALLVQKPHALIDHVALVLKEQLDGSWLKRQAAWKDRKVLDVVVLAPDEASFLQAISQWKPDLFWPVLMEESWYAPMFIAAFKPAAIIRHVKTKTDSSDVPSLLAKVSAAQNILIAARLKQDKDFFPPGVVWIDPASPLKLGGVALALGRNQPILSMTLARTSSASIKEEEVDKFNALFAKFFADLRMLRPNAWSGLTLAGELPFRYTPTDARAMQAALRVPVTGGYLSTDDRLGRFPNGLRYAVAGRLTGSAQQAIYQAMGSLFLTPAQAMFIDDYSNRGPGAFESYTLDSAAQILGNRMPIATLKGQQTAIDNIRRQLASGARDFMWINSSGGSDQWSVRGNGTFEDIPIGKASVWYLVHSFSNFNPFIGTTISGRALNGGAYWYFGSIYEPYLSAFALPGGVAHKMAAGTPLAMSMRHLPPHPLSSPWRLMGVGDPLFTLRPAGVQKTPYEKPEQIGGNVELFAAPAAAKAMDKLAALRWAAISQPDKAVEAASHAIGLGAKLPATDMARAAYVLHSAGRHDLLEVLDAATARKHPIAVTLAADSAEKMFKTQMDLGKTVNATVSLQQALKFGGSKTTLQGMAGLWVVAMKRDGLEESAQKLLKEWSESKEVPSDSRKVAKEALGG